jgi:hypothetical protein
MLALQEKIINSQRVRDTAGFFLNMNPITGLRNAEAYEEKPVDIETFVKHPHYLNLEQVIRPEIMGDLKAMFNDPTRFMHCGYQEACFDEAIGTGKSFKTSIIICYGLHHLLCLKNPQSYFGKDKSTLIAIMNMSINANQARKVVFGEIQSKVDNSRWFRRYHTDPNVRSELRFDKKITVIAGHSGARYPLGYNLIMAVMDEASFYNATPLEDTAQVMYYNLQSRIKTRFHPHAGLIIMISSPRYVDDFIERKMKEAELFPERIFSRRRAVWEVLEDDKEAIRKKECFYLVHPTTKESTAIPLRYQDDFQNNPERAWRDLGAVASLVLEPYFKQYDTVLTRVDYNLDTGIDQYGALKPTLKPISGQTYYIHIDLALTGDACGFAMAHKQFDAQRKEEIVVDIIHRIKGSKEKEIDISEVKNIVLAIKHRGFRLGKVTYDRFQSAQSIQDLKRQNIEAENLSVDTSLAPYDTLKELIYSGKIRYPFHEIFLKEIQRLELVQGKKIDHPAKGSKDCADAVAGAIYSAVEGQGTRVPTVTIVG